MEEESKSVADKNSTSSSSSGDEKPKDNVDDEQTISKQTEQTESIQTNGHTVEANEGETKLDEIQLDDDEANDDDKHESEPAKVLSQSMSNDFTYTTFGKPPDSDEQPNDDTNSLASPSAVNFDKSIVDEHSDTLNAPKYDTLDLHSVDIEQAEAALASKMDSLSVDTKNRSDSEDSIKKMTFDTIIENVKLNRIANKEVCDYILNLLVNGEFDLEKKFVIQNIRSIMHMIQVIKCARPSLKVTSLFDICYMAIQKKYALFLIKRPNFGVCLRQYYEKVN